MKKVFLIILGFACVFSAAAQLSNGHITKCKAKKWFRHKEWAGKLKLQPHSSINKQTFAYQYAANKRLWDTAFSFLSSHNLSTLEKGDYPLAGDSAVVKVTYGPAKEEKEAKWEAHQKYIDVQLVGSGKEKIGIAPLAKATPSGSYDAKKDVTNYTAKGRYYTAEPGTFFLFFPQDVHRPGLKIEDGNVRKIVVKIIAAP